ncbi:hypothetical protein D3C77_793550 [compost metagenome]
MLEPQLVVQRPIQVALQQVPGLAVVVVQDGLEEQPVQACAVAQPAAGQFAAGFGFMRDAIEHPPLTRLDRC